MTTIYHWCRKSFSLRIRGKLILSFSVAMIVLLSALGAITYFTFKDTISTSKKRIAELTLQNHILGFNDLVEELQHNVSETLFAADLGFSHDTLADINDTLQSKTDADPFLSSIVLVKGDQLVVPTRNAEFQELAASLPTALRNLKHGLLMTANSVWIRSPLPESMGPDMAAFFRLDQEHVWESILHENSREAGTLFFVTSESRVIMSHLESADHFNEIEAHTDADHHHSGESADSPLARLAANHDQLMELSRRMAEHGTELRHIGQNHIVANELGLLDWHAYSVIPESAFAKDLIKLRNRVIAATALTFWISLWIVLIVAHRISRPLISLSEATRDIQQHNYSTPLDFIRRRDEIGDLASSFETMRLDIEQLIHNDSLTGVFNRRYLLKTLNLQIAEAMETGQPASFIMIDLDHFKAINDTHGHMAGDAMLKASAKTIAAAVEGVGIVARYGGEEFCALLPGAAALQAQEVAERIRADMEALEIVFGDQPLSATCSLGIADIDSIPNARHLPWGHVVNLLITHADQALYHAKDTGRNRSVLTSPELQVDKAA